MTISASRSASRCGVLVWTDYKYGPNGGVQDTITYTASVSDPVRAFLKLKVSYGGAKIIKTSEDGRVDGITFTITGEGVNQTVTTDRNGEIRIDNLMPGVYTVTEQSYDKYVPQESHRVTVLAGQTATVSFNNVLRRGDLTVTKTSEDGLNQGVKFHLFGTSLSGLPVDEFAVTDENGVAAFKDVLIGTGYTLEEMDAAIRYVIPDSQSAAVEWNSVTNKSFSNILKKFNVTVTKSDCEVGTAQGDASLAGAAYGIYKGDQLVDTYYTDENGQFTTGYYVCGDDWTIREISPSEGYLLNSTVYPVGAEAANYTVELNAAPAVAVAEQVQKGNIAIIKHSDNGDTQIETPEEGAVFAVYLKSAGSYEAAKDTERDYLTCDENGFAQSKDLPYGVYTVHQVSGWEGRELMSDFDVFIAKNGETYRYLINNANFESFIKVIKVDAETGNTIPYAGAGFQIFRPDGSKVEMTFTYPEVTTIDTFYTNDVGMLITPEKLEFGKGYSLKEVFAPYGYVLSHEAVKFDVTEDNSTEESGVTVVAVKLGNYAQKGIIKISKTGEVFASVAAADGVYQPVYTVQGLAGATYEIKAAEDIYTPDGTLRCSAGEVVDTVTTGVDGMAESKPLYLGKYEITEMKAPDGMVINKDAHTAELVYAGQEIEITETAASFCNDRQKARISLSKVLEQNKQFGIGMNNELSAVTLGFYAAEELTAADGSVIPADGLIEILSLDENGKAVLKSDVPFGSYYVKEISTDSHYILSDEKYPVIFAYLKGVIFLNPMHISEEDGKPKYLPADEYLSGNVREKLRWAKRSAELYPEDYGENVRALEAVQPVDLTASEISVRLGATWLPPETIEEFMFELFSTPRYCQWNIHVHYAQYTGEWNVEGKSYDRSNVKAYNTYGTSRVNGYKIMEETLNLRDVRIFDYIEDGNGRKTAVLNKKETAIAQGKQELIKQAFADWIWSDPERREQLTKLYNEKFNSIRPREYDGSHLNFVGINPEITLRPHQVNAIAHILYGGNTLLAHVVGAGKTFEMVAAAQESKRLGLCQKSLFVVPNHLTEQWASEYLQLYPSANILVATKKDFETKNRKKFCGRIATGDYDAVIIGHSQFEKIPMSLERQRAILQQQLDEVLDGISELKKNRGDNFSIKQLERTKKTVKQKLDKLNDQSRKDDVVTFEELGVDRIFIDEAHYYKNLAAFTKMRNVGGISQTEAMKSSDLYMKCRYLDELTGGRGVVFATGTPISNSMVEMYTILMCLA